MFTTLEPAVQPAATILNIMSPSKWATRICAAWQKQLPGIFETGVLLESAKDELRPAEWRALLSNKELPFGKRTANRLIAIAKDDRLRSETHASRLPACLMTLYELTKLTSEQFEQGIETGVINPKMMRKDLKPLLGDKGSGSSSKPSVREQLAEAKAEIQRLKRNGGDLFSANDSVRDIARVLVDTINSTNKFEKIVATARELMAERLERA
jgi:hypothetical protein